MAERHGVARGKDGGNTIEIPRSYVVSIDLHKIDEAYEDDEVTLKSDDGAYSQTLVIGKDGVMVDDRWVDLIFLKILPDKTYSCVHDLKRTSTGHTGTHVLFRGLNLDVDRGSTSAVRDDEDRILAESPDWTVSHAAGEDESPEEVHMLSPKEEDHEGLWLHDLDEEQGWDVPDDPGAVEDERSYYEEADSDED